MNRGGTRAVESAASRLRKVTQIAAFLGVIGCPACIQIEGGAVELSWSLRDFDGDSVGSCSDAGLTGVEVCWAPVGDASVTPPGGPCRPGQRRIFDCGEANGVSRFEIPPGPTAFWIAPICSDGQAADVGTYQVPPPIVRTVEDGKIVTLDSLLIVVGRQDRGQCDTGGCTCAR